MLLSQDFPSLFAVVSFARIFHALLHTRSTGMAGVDIPVYSRENQNGTTEVQSQLAIMNLAIVNGKIVIGPLSCFPAMLLADLP